MNPNHKRWFGWCYRQTLGIAAAALMLTAANCGPADLQSELSTDAEKPIDAQSLPADIQAALRQISGGQDITILLANDHGVPEFVKGRLGQLQVPQSVPSVAEAQALLGPALQLLAPVFRLQSTELRVKRALRDRTARLHIRTQQTLNGLDVIGGELILHVDPQGLLYAVNGSAEGPSGARPALPKEATSPAGSPSETPAATGRLVYYRDANGQLVLSRELLWEGMRDGEPARDLVYINAETGVELGRHPQRWSLTPLLRAVFDAGNTEALPGALTRAEGVPATGDAHVDDNYDHIGASFNCFQTLFGYDSFDGRGAPISSTVHYAAAYNNAHAGNRHIWFGDGDGRRFGPLGADPDIVTHEFGHLITAETSGLIYKNQSGALNESMSDVFAAICASFAGGFKVDDSIWKIGEAAFTPMKAGDALRYLNKPTDDGSSVDHYSELKTGTADSGYVHSNSGIPNLAFRLLVTGGTHPRGKSPVRVTGIGIMAAAQIWFNAENFYLTSTSTLKQARLDFIQAADDSLAPQQIIDAVGHAWLAVGVK